MKRGKKIKENVLEVLLQKNRTFAVCVNSIRTGSEFGRDYFIIALSFDIRGIKGFRRRASDLYNVGHLELSEHSLTDIELDYFKKIQNKFVKVLHGKEGRVYELKERSFREYLILAEKI